MKTAATSASASGDASKPRSAARAESRSSSRTDPGAEPRPDQPAGSRASARTETPEAGSGRSRRSSRPRPHAKDPWSRFKDLVLSIKFRLSFACLVLILGGATLIQPKLLEPIGQHSVQVMLDQEYDATQRVADVIKNRIVLVQLALRDLTLNVAPEVFSQPQAAAQFLAARPVLSRFFSSAYVVAPDGRVLALRDQEGGLHQRNLSLADRAYFRDTVKLGRTVVSEPLIGWFSLQPEVVVTMPISAPDGSLLGIVCGSILLGSNDPVAADLTQSHEGQSGQIQTLVTDGQGRILSHPSRERILHDVATIPGLERATQEWIEQGRPIEPDAVTVRSPGHIVTRAGVPGVDWMVFRVVNEQALLGGVIKAQNQIWKLSIQMGVAGTLIMLGLLAWMLRPLEQLERRAEQLFDGDRPAHEGWPQLPGEIGQLSRVLQQVLHERERAERYNAGLLRKMHSLLATAPIGIAFSRGERFELVSKEFAALFGRRRGDLIGRRTQMIYASDTDYTEMQQRMPQAFAEQGQFDGELQLMRRDGSRFWGRVMSRPVDPQQPDTGAIWLLHDITREREERENLSWSATHDALTGLHNRRAFERELADALDHRQVLGNPALLFIDLDHFKRINDTAGHAVGDQVLVSVAKILMSNVRADDMVARLGGDEFVVLLSGCDIETAVGIADRVRVEVKALSFESAGGLLQVGISTGVAELDESVADVAAALALADGACYAAKRSGRDAVERSIPGGHEGSVLGDLLIEVTEADLAIDPTRFGRMAVPA